MFHTLLKKKALTAKKLTAQNYYRLCGKTNWSWRYVANFRPWWEYQRERPAMSKATQQCLRDLIATGMIMTAVEDLLDNSRLFEEMDAAVREKEAELAECLNKRFARDSAAINKSYFLPLLGSRPVLDPSSIFARFALAPQIISIVNGYFGMLTKLRYYNVWHNFVTQDRPRESQLWHRDPEDRAVLKVFVYLTDVTAGCGPLSYAPGTHLYGNSRKSAPSTLRREGSILVHRSDDNQMNSIVPRSSWLTATGPKGSIVIADTRGYHKGGHVTQSDRILYTCAFTSKGSVFPETWQRDIVFSAPASRATAFALN